MTVAEPTIQLDHLSWSGVQTYRSCPRQFALRYVEHAISERSSSTLIFGTAIHSAIEQVHVARMKSQPRPTEQEILSEFDDNWSAAVARAPEVCFAKNQDATTLRELAQRMLAAYRAQLDDDAEVIAIEEEFRFSLLPELPPILARIDLIEVRGHELILTDFKTSKGCWGEAKGMENAPQLVLYACASLPLLERLGLQYAKPKFCVITKGKVPKVQTINPPVSGDDVVRLRSMFAEVWSYISRGWFPRIESWRCRSGCPYRTHCLGN